MTHYEYNNTGSGVQIGGNAEVNARVIAGSMGSADAAADLAELRRLLAWMADQLRVPAPEVADPGVLTTMVASAQQEAAKDQPNMGLLSGLLHALMAGAGNVTALATAITAAQHVVSSFL